jgi:hypothetical protein
MIYESKCRRRTRLRIDDLIDELGRTLTYDEIKTEFAKRGFPRPFRKVVEDIFLKILILPLTPPDIICFIHMSPPAMTSCKVNRGKPARSTGFRGALPYPPLFVLPSLIGNDGHQYGHLFLSIVFPYSRVVQQSAQDHKV